jgi:hypothetical protein
MSPLPEAGLFAPGSVARGKSKYSSVLLSSLRSSAAGG